TYVAEIIAHEVGHLFASRLNRKAPPLFAEGLAVWLQGSLGDAPLDLVARSFCRTAKLEIETLSAARLFFSVANQRACYALAGSFTKFLIDRFGWVRFKGFYRRARGKTLQAVYSKTFGESLAETEARWRRRLHGATAAGTFSA